MQKLQDFPSILAAIHLFFKIVINLKILENSQEYVYVTLYVYETVKHEVINVDFLRKDLHSVPWGIISPQRHHSLFFCQTPLNLQTVQVFTFLGSSSLCWFFIKPSP